MADIRINVLGASGSGASTVGRSLSAALTVPHFDSDEYYHAPTDPPFQEPRAPEERYEMLCRDLSCDKVWVLSGGLMGWTPCPVLDFTLMVFLYVPTEVRIERLRRRERERFGERVLEDGDMHGTHTEFLNWAAQYDVGDIEGKTLDRHEAYLNSQSCPLLQFRGLVPVSEITRKVILSVFDAEGST